MGKFLILIACLGSSYVRADEVKLISLSSVYSPEYIESLTPEFIINRSPEANAQFKYHGMNKHIPRIDGETAERLLDYIKADDLYIYDLEKAELSLKAKYGSSSIYEFRGNLVYAYQALVAYDVNQVGKIGLAFDVGLEYLKRVKYDSIHGSMDPMLQILFYRAEHTSNRTTVQRLIEVLSEVSPTTTLKFVTNGLKYQSSFRFTWLEHFLEEYIRNDTFYHAPDKNALFTVIKRTIDYLYEVNTKKTHAEIRNEIYRIAVVAKHIFSGLQAPEAVRYLQNVIVREVSFKERNAQKSKALGSVLRNSQAETNFSILLTEFIKRNLVSQNVVIPFDNTEVEFGWVRRAITPMGEKVIQLGETKTEYLYTIRLVNPGEYADQALRIAIDLLLLNPYNRGIYYEHKLRIPSKIDISKMNSQHVGKEGIILRPKAGLQCASLFN